LAQSAYGQICGGNRSLDDDHGYYYRSANEKESLDRKANVPVERNGWQLLRAEESRHPLGCPRVVTLSQESGLVPGMLELLESFRGQACSTCAIHIDPGREVQEFIAIPGKDILVQCKAATAVAEQTVVPSLVLEILCAERVERHRDPKVFRVLALMAANSALFAGL
jgi:hypothetical protein